MKKIKLLILTILPSCYFFPILVFSLELVHSEIVPASSCIQQVKHHKNKADRKIRRLKYGDSGEVLRCVKTYLPENPIIVEAGAWDGRDSVLMAQFWPQGHIYAFDPVPSHFQSIKKHSAQFRNIYPCGKALSDVNGVATFYLSVHENNPDEISGSSSLLQPKEHLAEDPSVSFPYAMEVETITLDSWAQEMGIDHVDFLWLDMQGFELNMIKASELARNARAIWLEVEFIEAYTGQYLFKDIMSWMEAHDFVLAATNFNVEKPESWFADALFVKKSVMSVKY